MTGEQPRDESTVLPAAEGMGLTFADGFQFGCGFMVAAALSFLVLCLGLFALALLLTTLGVL